MGSNKVSAGNSLFRSHKSHSVQEILDAGGTTAFGIKSGKNNETLIAALEKLPPVDFSDEEWDDLMKQLENDK